MKYYRLFIQNNGINPGSKHEHLENSLFPHLMTVRNFAVTFKTEQYETPQLHINFIL